MALVREIEKKFSLYIIGTTATGKTKLSISLASKFGGQIVSADSMQMYRHADILTAKATKEEQAAVPHHMIDIFDVQVTNFNRNDYFHLAMRSFDQIHSLNSFPVVIGGTNYYIETLLFKQKIAPNRIDLDNPNEYILALQNKDALKSSEETKSDLAPLDEEDLLRQKLEKEISSMTLSEKYAKLQQLDPLLANKLHCNDDRRVSSYLLQALLSGTSPSDNMDDHENVPLRSKNCLIFWPRCKSKEKLDKQIRNRIKDMVSPEGILEAFFIFESILPKELPSEEDPVFLKGVLQSIGYKEFLPFYRLYKSKGYSLDATREEKLEQIKGLLSGDEAGKKILAECIEQLSIHTIQYTKRQLKWIRHRILTNSDSEEIKNRLFVFEFDEFTSADFEAKVINPATKILQEYFSKAADVSVSEKDDKKTKDSLNLTSDEENEEISSKIIEAISKGDNKKFLINEEEIKEVRKSHYKKGLQEWKNYVCNICEKDIHGDQNWKIHLDSRKHKRSMKSKEKKEIRAKKLAEGIENNKGIDDKSKHDDLLKQDESDEEIDEEKESQQEQEGDKEQQKEDKEIN